MAETTQTSINLPQIIAVALVGFFAIRWFLNKPSTSSPSGSSTNTSGSSRRTGQEVDPTKIAQVSAMFPQVDPRSIAWDLNANGSNVAATTERILSGRGLDAPPASYRPRLPGTPPTPTTQQTKRGGPASQPDLITRYGLQGRVGGKGKEAMPSESAEVEERRQAAQWSSDKAARAEGLRKRREEMVLAARRRMEAKGEGV